MINTGSDRGQLSTMAKQARIAMDADELVALADRGYYKSEEILACDNADIVVVLPKPKTSNNPTKGFFSREDFRFLPEDDEYVCPAGERLMWRLRTVEKGRKLDGYWSSACPRCAIKQRCTSSTNRRLYRWAHEDVLDAVQDRLDQQPESMRLRRQTVEHPFGTFKAWMGYTHFLTKTLRRVRTAMSLHVLAYNLKRVIAIIGVKPLIAATEG